MYLLQDDGVPAGAVFCAEDTIFGHHLRARGHVVTVNHPLPKGPLEYPGLTLRFSPTGGADTTPAPAPGQDNEDIFVGLLKLTREEYQRLRAAKVVG